MRAALVVLAFMVAGSSAHPMGRRHGHHFMNRRPMAPREGAATSGGTETVRRCCSDDFQLVCDTGGLWGWGAHLRGRKRVVPLGFGSRAADDCMRTNLELLSPQCQTAIQALDGSLTSKPAATGMSSFTNSLPLNVVAPSIFDGNKALGSDGMPLLPGDASSGSNSTPGGSGEDYQDLPSPNDMAIMAFVAVLAWGILAVLFVRSFMRKEAHHDKMLKYWQTISTDPELKSAVERASGESDFPQPPKNTSCLKFVRVVLVGLILVLSLQLALGLALPPPAYEPTAEDQNLDPSDGSQVFGAFLFLILASFVGFAVMKGLKKLCTRNRNTTPTPDASHNATAQDAPSAPPAYATVTGGGGGFFHPPGYHPLPSTDPDTDSISGTSTQRQEQPVVYIGQPVPAHLVTG